MNNFIIYKDNRIAFLKGLSKANGIFEPLTDDQLVVAQGYLIPLSPTAFNTLDMLEGTLPENSTANKCYSAVIIDSQGVVREYYNESQTTTVLRKPVGPGFVGACARGLAAEEAAWAAVNLADTLEEAVELYTTKQGIDSNHVSIMSLSDVMNILNKVD